MVRLKILYENRILTSAMVSPHIERVGTIAPTEHNNQNLAITLPELARSGEPNGRSLQLVTVWIEVAHVSQGGVVSLRVRC